MRGKLRPKRCGRDSRGLHDAPRPWRASWAYSPSSSSAVPGWPRRLGSGFRRGASTPGIRSSTGHRRTAADLFTAGQPQARLLRQRSPRTRPRGVRDTARSAAGEHATTGGCEPVPPILPVKPRPGGRVRVGVAGELDTARAGPRPASRLPSLNPERLRLHFGNQRRSSKTLRSLSKSPSVASVSDQLQSGFRQ